MIAFIKFALTSLREAFNVAFSRTNLNARTLVPLQYADTEFTKGTIQVLDGKRYYVHPEVVGQLEGINVEKLTPIFLISMQNGAKWTQNEIEAFIKQSLLLDDVLTDSFLTTLIIGTTENSTQNPVLDKLGFVSPRIIVSRILGSEINLPSGPYFIRSQSIHQAWRLYEDSLDAFVIPTIPCSSLSPERFDPLGVASAGGRWKEVAVPSRLYHQATSERPLAGMRISVKDIFDLQGIQTTLSSRDWMSIYGPAEITADYVQRLIQLGAVIVGKTTSSPFVSADTATDQWIDFHCPFSARGDGYQDPAGSSSGAGASLTGYEWLDLSVGSDTGGSIRAPASYCGLFGLRTSWNTTSLRGMKPASRDFDTVGLLGRSTEPMKQVAAKTFQLKSPTNLPKRIIYPMDFFPEEDEMQQRMVEQFVSILEEYMGSKREVVSISKMWEVSPPKEAHGKCIMEYLEKAGFWPYCREFYDVFAEFRDTFGKELSRPPFVGPTTEFRWNLGRCVTESDYWKFKGEQKVFRDWFHQNILAEHPESLSDAVMVLPYKTSCPEYMDVPHDPPGTFHSFTTKLLSPILQVPQLVIPIGQKPYFSRISQRVEYSPVVCTLLGARGSDLMLLELAEKVLEQADWPSTVLTGRFTFAPSENQHPLE